VRVPIAIRIAAGIFLLILIALGLAGAYFNYQDGPSGIGPALIRSTMIFTYLGVGAFLLWYIWSRRSLASQDGKEPSAPKLWGRLDIGRSIPFWLLIALVLVGYFQMVHGSGLFEQYPQFWAVVDDVLPLLVAVLAFFIFMSWHSSKSPPPP
jgi:magnesium-transporting ATPase (P-type)